MGAFKFISIPVGLLFAVSGVAKLWPAGAVHEHMTKEFVTYTTVFPLKDFGVQPSPSTFQFVIGVVETFGGILLMFGSYRLKKLTSLPLLIIMFGAVWTLYHLKQPAPMIAFPGVVGIGLTYLMMHGGEKPKIE
ncbi:transmembrane protein 35B-like [Glandiceps talaboti]